jgi:hypothetical protein
MNPILLRIIQVGALLVVLLNAGCGGGSSTTTVTSKSFSNCYSYANPGNATNYFGNFAVRTDIWNPIAATSYTECVNATVDLNLGIRNAQFDWAFFSSTSQVITYPNISFGQQPGFPTSTTTKLPALVSAMPNLNVTGTIDTTCAIGPCYFDSAFDLFFSNTATPTTYPPKIELMIWTAYNVGYKFGTPAATVTIGGAAFNVYTSTVTPPGSIYSWPMIQYLATTPITQLNLNIKDFVGDALSHGYVASTDYLDVVEIGTEVRSGQGSTVITNYNIQ